MCSSNRFKLLDKLPYIHHDPTQEINYSLTLRELLREKDTEIIQKDNAKIKQDYTSFQEEATEESDSGDQSDGNQNKIEEVDVTPKTSKTF